MGLVYGKGIYELGKYKSKIERKQTIEYETWKAMLRRCYCENNLIINPSYVGCLVSNSFLNYQYFAEWCNDQIGFGNCGWCLDKDLLIKGNKIYSEDTCCFVPAELNVLFTKRNASRGKFPIGVNYHKGQKKYNSKITIFGKQKNLGSFNCPNEAFNLYKIEKEKHIKFLADKYKNLIDIKIYQALYEYEVNIND